ncbi:unnamed protein product [Caenorhabditis auriculariae]|uniref:Uncharacterized protein n=1 Tax=Caenorhabditis auriculariae TaxID=2777116 RepID=A0A8S1GZ42_9PELO|nr:unnamed protein product [Caenorhabditis auriculariae]
MSDGPPAGKRSRLDEEEKPSEMHEDASTQLAALRCLGALPASLGAESSSSGNGSRASLRLLSTQEEKELRRDRGELLLRLFRDSPSLAHSASARRLEKNQERAAMWESITAKVNSEFGDKLEVLTVEKVKKLLTYYKKKEDGSYDNIRPKTEPPDEGTSSTSMESDFGSSLNEAWGRITIEENADNKELIDFLALMASEGTTSPSESSTSIRTLTPTTETGFQLKKDRHDYVVNLAEHYMQRMCFDNSSRSAAVNAERHNMWINIAHKANERFADALGPLGVEQAKKLYSNCKRRRRVRKERSEEDMCQASPQGSSGTEREEISDDPLTDFNSNTNSNSTDPLVSNFEQLIRGLDRSAELDEMRNKLAEKEAEVATLRKRVAEQAEEYAVKTKAMLELLKVAVDKKTSDDIKYILSI